MNGNLLGSLLSGMSSACDVHFANFRSDRGALIVFGVGDREASIVVSDGSGAGNVTCSGYVNGDMPVDMLVHNLSQRISIDKKA